MVESVEFAYCVHISVPVGPRAVPVNSDRMVCTVVSGDIYCLFTVIQLGARSLVSLRCWKYQISTT